MTSERATTPVLHDRWHDALSRMGNTVDWVRECGSTAVDFFFPIYTNAGPAILLTAHPLDWIPFSTY